jgi:hypothetical protein
MNFTEKYFKFPTRIYDGYSLKKAEEIERTTEEPVEAEWVRGFISVKAEDILGWYDSYSKSRTPEQVTKEGFDFTVIETRSLGPVSCNWKREKFEEELNKFFDRIQEETKKVQDELMSKMMGSSSSPEPLFIDLLSVQPKKNKKSFWKRWFK